MTEFLKNNPMALRHCLLYKYLQNNSDEQWFSIFCMMIGDDVMKKEKIHFWFNQFKQGIFDMNNDKEPITDMRDVLRSDKYALRACIFYESIKYKGRGSLTGRLNCLVFKMERDPSFFMYNNFCNVVGKDMMEYREFDFWFYRFLNEEFDLKYESEEYKKTRELTDMPIDVMKTVVEYLNLFDRMNLKKTSRSFRTFVENQKLFHDTLTISISQFEATVSLSNSVYIEYFRDSVGCRRVFKDPRRRACRVDHWKPALLDFKGILNNPKLHLDTLEIELDVDNRNVFSDLEDELKFTHYLNVKNVTLVEHSSELLVKIVPMLKPGYLKTIYFGSHTLDENSMKITEMEQWKQAKIVHMNEALFLWPLHHLYHFKEFSVRSLKLSVENIREMKEVLFKSPNFEHCLIIVDDDTGANAIEKEFGDYIQQRGIYSEYVKVYDYPIPNSSEYFEIEVLEWDITITRKKR